jgi:hypothetical protein
MSKMNTMEEANRAVNLLATAIVGLAALAFLPETIVENDLIDKVDDSLLVILGFGAVAWYLSGSHRYMRSIIPVVLVALAIAVKVFAIAVEFSDAEAVGDDFGGLVLFVAGTALVAYEYQRAPKEAGGG